MYLLAFEHANVPGLDAERMAVGVEQLLLRLQVFAELTLPRATTTVGHPGRLRCRNLPDNPHRKTRTQATEMG